MNNLLDIKVVELFGVYSAVVSTYINGSIEVKIDEKGIYLKKIFQSYSLREALKITRQEIKQIEGLRG